jgi:hypothetical protein
MKYPPDLQLDLSSSIFSLLYIMGIQGIYVKQKLDTTSFFAKLKAISTCSVFFVNWKEFQICSL